MPAGDVAHRPVRYKGLLTVFVMGAMLMQVLDATIANVALPHMQASLGATADSVTWVLTSYILAVAIAIPLSGWISARFGIRNVLLASVATFVLASMLCGMAANLQQMVFFRLLQGVGGAFLAPLAQTIMLDINKPSDHPRAMTTYGMAVMIGPIAGPIIGGWLTDNFDWRWVFYVNAPVGVACWIGLWALLPHAQNNRRPFDMLGWAFIAVALGALQLMLDRGPHAGWFDSTEIWIYTGTSAAGFWCFAVHLATSSRPLFPLAMLKDRNLLTGSSLLFTIALVMMSTLAILPSMLQGLYGYTVVDTGLLLAVRGAAMMMAMWLAGRTSHRADPRAVMALGFVLLILSLWMMTGWSLEMDWRPVVTSGFVQGLGLGFAFAPLNILTFATLPPHLRTDASSLFSLARSLGASIGIAVVTALTARNIQTSHADLAAAVTPYNLPLDPSMADRFGPFGGAAMMMLDGIVNKQAIMIAYLDDFQFMMIASGLLMPILLFIRPPARGAASSPPVMME
ncbi:MAG TPA: DHA2 family efflux MFS transporter permease subunit [Sphingobium sp.]